MPQEHAEIRGAASLCICRGHMTDRAVMTGASRDLAVLGEHLAVLGALSRVIASSEAAVLVAGITFRGRAWQVLVTDRASPQRTRRHAPTATPTTALWLRAWRP